MRLILAFAAACLLPSVAAHAAQPAPSTYSGVVVHTPAMNSIIVAGDFLNVTLYANPAATCSGATGANFTAFNQQLRNDPTDYASVTLTECPAASANATAYAKLCVNVDETAPANPNNCLALSYADPNPEVKEIPSLQTFQGPVTATVASKTEVELSSSSGFIVMLSTEGTAPAGCGEGKSKLADLIKKIGKVGNSTSNATLMLHDCPGSTAEKISSHVCLQFGAQAPLCGTFNTSSGGTTETGD